MEELTLFNICAGAVAERFQRELLAAFKNIRDVNTPPDEVRKITLDFKFKPFADRSGAEVTFSCKSKHAPADNVAGTIYITAVKGELAAYPRDPRQDSLFTEHPTETQ